MFAGNILSLMVILTITICIGQAAYSCVCINDDDYYLVDGASYHSINNYGGYNDPPNYNNDLHYANYYNFNGAAGAAHGRIFFRYDGVLLSTSTRYTAVGCGAFTSSSSPTNGGTARNCAGSYGFASAADCTSCGTCCCNAANTASGVCTISTGD